MYLTYKTKGGYKMRETSYIELLNEVIEILRNTKEIVIATCHKGRVTARTVYCICDDVHIYFITSKAYTKYKQIKANPNIALSINNIQIEGEAEILGHPLDKENDYFKAICEKNKDYIEYYKKYSNYKNSIVIKANPVLITLYNGKGSYKYINLQEKKGYKKGRT